MTPMNVTIKQILNENQCSPGEVFSFNANTKTITYVPEELEKEDGSLALLHEIAHMKLDHFSYNYDVELLGLEHEAWEETRRLAKEYNMEVDENHIKECLESYDKWLDKRATCPKCGEYSLQRDKNTFGCFVCDCYWKVNERKDREVRKKIISKIQDASDKTQIIVKSQNTKQLVPCFLFLFSSINRTIHYL